MKYRFFFYALAALAASGLFVYMRSDAVRIRCTFDAVARLACKEPAETVMESAIRARSIAAYLAQSCSCSLSGHGAWTALSRENAAGAVLALRSDLKTLRVTFEKTDVSSGGGVASVTGSVSLDGSPSTGKFPLPCVMTFEAELKDEDGKWVFTRFRGRPSSR